MAPFAKVTSTSRNANNAFKILGSLGKEESLDESFKSAVVKRNKIIKAKVVVPLMSVNEIVAWFKQIQFQWQTVSAKYRVNFQIDFSSIYNNVNNIARRQRQFSDAIQREGMFPETIDTVVRVIQALENGDNVALNGLIQSAKSASQTTSAMLFGVIHYLAKNQKTMPIFLLPNGDSYVNQFSEKLSWVQVLIYDAEITVNGQSILVKDYYRDAIKHERNVNAKQFARIGAITNRNKVMRTLDEVCSNGDHIIVPVSKRYQEVIRILVNSACLNGWLTLLDRDESHHSVAKNSVNDRTFGGDFEESGIEILSDGEKAIYEMIQDKNVQVMAVSATNWPAMMDKFVQIPVTVNCDNYCGLDQRYFGKNDKYGKLVARDMGVKIKLPEIFNLTNFANMVGNVNIKYLRGSLYVNHKSFCRYKEDHPDFPFKSHEEYKHKSNTAISDSCKWFIAKNPKNAQGILIRLANDNAAAGELADFLEKSLPGVTIIRYFDNEFTTIADLLVQQRVSDGFYVIIATARGRMSDSFPSHCAYGLDLTRKSSTLGALLQGVLGRMCGYNKNPIVVLSDMNEKRIREYIESDYTKYGGKLLGTSSVKHRNATMQFVLKDFHDDSRMKKIFAKLNTQILYGGQKRNWFDPVKRQIVMGHQYTTDCFFVVLDKEEIDYLNELSVKKTSLSILMKGQENTNGVKYALNDFGYVVVTVRMQTPGKDTKQGGRAGRRSNEASDRVAYIMFRVGVKYNKPVLEAFDIPLYQRPVELSDIVNDSCFTRMK